MALHVLFTEDGIPGWIGLTPREDSEELPDEVEVEGELIPVTIPFLAAHRRTAAGEWVLRPPPPPPTEEDIARRQADLARIEAQQQADAERWREEEIARRAQPDALLRSMGKITIAELNVRVAAIRADVEAGT